MKVAIVGAGAIGGLLAEAFARSGHDVSLVARGPHGAALAAGGLVIRDSGEERRYRLPVTDDPVALGEQDAVIIALKAYSIGPMLSRIGPLLAERTAVVTAINGLPWWYFYRHGGAHEGLRIDCLDPDGAMRDALDPAHIVGCVVHAAGEVVAPGVVQTANARRYVLGELDGRQTPRLSSIATAVRTGGSEVEIAADIRNAIWMKLIGNLSYNPVAALALARMHEIHASEGLLRCIRRQMEEAMRVAEHYGQRITMSPDERIDIARKLGNAKISMHQDLERGRPLEIDAIIGAVLELAQRAKLATPMIDAIHALITERARHR